MKKLFSQPRSLFSLLACASATAVALGAYLAAALSAPAGTGVRILAAIGLALWTGAWGAFGRMCLSLRRGQSAFTPATERTLRVIGVCLIGLAIVTNAASVLNGQHRSNTMFFIEAVLLPWIFLCAAMAATILRGLLIHAMALETEQEGVI